MNNKKLIRFAKIYSALLLPFYAPTWAFLWLFCFSFLSMTPLVYKIFVISAVVIFTCIIPRIGIDLYRKIMKWTHKELSARENRFIPYILAIMSYVVCVFVFNNINTAQFMQSMIIAALISQIICMIINVWWKVSTHMMGIGGLSGTYIAFSYIFYFNPVAGFSVLVLLSGLLGSARIILKQHSLSQIIVGYLIGLVCSLFTILIAW